MVEILVHYAAVLKSMCLSILEIPDDIPVADTPIGALPDGWENEMETTRGIGSEWFRKKTSAVLCVPSCVAHGEINYLLNTQHPDFSRILFLTSRPFEFDPRLK
jgi:RES domain-containing protein